MRPPARFGRIIRRLLTLHSEIFRARAFTPRHTLIRTVNSILRLTAQLVRQITPIATLRLRGTLLGRRQVRDRLRRVPLSRHSNPRRNTRMLLVIYATTLNASRTVRRTPANRPRRNRGHRNSRRLGRNRTLLPDNRKRQSDR